jgi:hypothetical protein
MGEAALCTVVPAMSQERVRWFARRCSAKRRLRAARGGYIAWRCTRRGFGEMICAPQEDRCRPSGGERICSGSVETVSCPPELSSQSGARRGRGDDPADSYVDERHPHSMLPRERCIGRIRWREQPGTQLPLEKRRDCAAASPRTRPALPSLHTQHRDPKGQAGGSRERLQM